MKRFPPIAYALAALMLAVWSSPADTTSIMGTLATVNNTSSNTTAVVSGTVTLPRGTFSVSNGGLTATNACAVIEQVSVDGLNWTSVRTNYFTATNAATQAFAGGNVAALSVSTRLLFTTTNSVNVGASYTQP